MVRLGLLDRGRIDRRLHRVCLAPSPTRVGTYAYVNPVIAVLLGYFLGGESIGPRTIAGTLLVLVSVVVITTTPRKGSMALPAKELDVAAAE
jgi:hypothetical protein